MHVDMNCAESYLHNAPFDLGRMAMASESSDQQRNRFGGQLRIEALRDPVIEAAGHEAGSAYRRRYYLPLIGPSSLLCAEILSEGLTHQPDGYELDVAVLGAVLGLPGKVGRSSTVARTLARSTAWPGLASPATTLA
jgi:hypothetical protein